MRCKHTKISVTSLGVRQSTMGGLEQLHQLEIRIKTWRKTRSRVPAEVNHLFQPKLIIPQLLSRVCATELLNVSELIINQISHHYCPPNICSLMDPGWSHSLGGLFGATCINPRPLLKPHDFNRSSWSPKATEFCGMIKFNCSLYYSPPAIYV